MISLNLLLFLKIPIAKVVNVEVIITILDERRKHVTQNLVKSKIPISKKITWIHNNYTTNRTL